MTVPIRANRVIGGRKVPRKTVACSRLSRPGRSIGETIMSPADTERANPDPGGYRGDRDRSRPRDGTGDDARTCARPECGWRQPI